MKSYKEIIQTVLELHRKEEENNQQDDESEPRIGPCSQEIEGLRKRIPEEILAHHDNLRPLGKSSVAALKDGCCEGCSRVLPAIDRIAVESGEWPVICKFCGALLYDEETISGAWHGPARDVKQRTG
ncbi:MAG: hypothetical protein WD490_00795 [Opitutales bacterium]